MYSTDEIINSIVDYKPPRTGYQLGEILGIGRKELEADRTSIVSKQNESVILDRW